MSAITSKVVAIADIPAVVERVVGKYLRIYEQIAQLKSGQALMVEFETLAVANYARNKIRKYAAHDKQFLSSSRTNAGKTRYFWLEKAK